METDLHVNYCLTCFNDNRAFAQAAVRGKLLSAHST